MLCSILLDVGTLARITDLRFLSSNSNFSVISRSGFVFFFFPLKGHVCCFFGYLPFFSWMPDTVNFIFLSTGYFCSHLYILELCLSFVEFLGNNFILLRLACFRPKQPLIRA